MSDAKKGPRDEKHDKLGYRRQTQIHDNLEEPAEEAPAKPPAKQPKKKPAAPAKPK